MSKSKTEPAADSAAAGLPLFYSAPTPMSKERHGGKSLTLDRGFEFARGYNSLPITGDEFWLAARHYPILFARGDSPTAIALVGLRPDENLFLDEDGRWEQGSYVPTYVRRYPFIFMNTEAGDRLVLCVDEASGMLLDDDSNPFYRDEKPTEVVDNALRFCADYQKKFQVTRAFCEALVEHDLLIDRAANISLATGETVNLTGFRVVDDERLADLPNKVFLDWRRRGWLPLVYLHMISLQSWSALVDRAAEAAA